MFAIYLNVKINIRMSIIGQLILVKSKIRYYEPVDYKANITFR